MNLEEVQNFVELNKVALTEENKFGRCVDGRYEKIENLPMIAKPGADAGDIMIVFGALNVLGKSIDNDKVFDIVVSNVGGIDKFNFHTDDHADQSVPGLGCGHLKQAKADPIAYGLKQDQIDFIFEQLPQAIAQSAHQEVLHGDHAEQAVIVVDSETHGVKPLSRNDENLHEAFIYQKTLHEKQLDKLAQALQIEFAAQGNVVEELEAKNALDSTFAKQLGETLKRLANGLPVYVAKIKDDGEVLISQ